MQGETVSGNKFEIEATKDYETGSFGRYYYWSTIYVIMNGHRMDIDDLSERNKELVIEQLPYL